MQKGIRVLAVILAMMGILAAAASVKAANSGEIPAIPQKNGTFDVPGHPKLKAHVFVHYPKMKIGPEQTPVLQCQIPDPNTASIVAAAGWKLPSPFSYNLNPSSAPSSIGQENMKTLSENAFDAWSEAINKKVIFASGGDTLINKQSSLDRKNIVAWGRTPQSALGVTYIITKGGEVYDLDTILNERIVWSWSDPTAWKTAPDTTCAFQKTYDAQNILTHELGHWMGLDDEYNSQYFANSTMFGYGSKGETKKDTLTAGDVAGLKLIYNQ